MKEKQVSRVDIQGQQQGINETAKKMLIN